jgi:tRNA uridine 5-carbamoylmethylation protein Kti12
MKQICSIMRGVPGSGKSTRAKKLKEELEKEGHEVIICSTDDFFIKNGKYEFDYRLLGINHALNFKKFKEAIEAGHSVIVDNTNVRIEHFEPYIEIAKKYGHEVQIHTMLHPDLTNGSNNTHGVPIDVIQKMIDGFENFIQWEFVDHEHFGV